MITVIGNKTLCRLIRSIIILVINKSDSHSCEYRLNWTPLSPITITYITFFLPCCCYIIGFQTYKGYMLRATELTLLILIVITLNPCFLGFVDFGIFFFFITRFCFFIITKNVVYSCTSKESIEFCMIKKKILVLHACTQIILYI